MTVLGTAGFLADSDHNRGGSSTHRIDVGCEIDPTAAHVGHQGVVAGSVVLGREAELRRVRCRAIEERVVDGACVHEQRHELGHGRTAAVSVVCGHHVCAHGRDVLAVRQGASGGWFVGHQRPHIGRVSADEYQRIDRTPARGEHIHRPMSDGGEHCVQVVGMLAEGDRGRRVVSSTASHISRVVRDDHSVAEMRCQRPESARIHR